MSKTPKLTPEERAEAAILYERLSGDGDALERFIYFAVSIRAKLERELAAERERADRNQEDAERYRWLRDTDTAVVAWIEEDGPRWSIEGRDGHKITRDKLDAAIDAARRK